MVETWLIIVIAYAVGQISGVMIANLAHLIKEHNHD
jgi:hypothetical protein